MGKWSVYRNDRRGFGQPVTFVDADADIGIPLGQVAAERRASGNENIDTAAHAGANFGKDKLNRQSPCG